MKLDWNAIVVALIAAIPAMFIALGAWRQSSKNGKDLKANTAETVETKSIINGRMDELLRLAKKEAFASGVIEGLKQAKAINLTADIDPK